MNPGIARLLVAAALLAGLTACSRQSGESAGSAPVRHAHRAPHGGVLVELGDHQGNLELVLDRTAGRLRLFVLDAHASNFVRVAQPSVELVLTLVEAGGPRSLVLGAVANPMTGETVGHTAQFEGQADWLRGVIGFDGRVTQVSVQGKTYSHVPFSYRLSLPEQSAHEHSHR